MQQSTRLSEQSLSLVSSSFRHNTPLVLDSDAMMAAIVPNQHRHHAGDGTVLPLVSGAQRLLWTIRLHIFFYLTINDLPFKYLQETKNQGVAGPREAMKAESPPCSADPGHKIARFLYTQASTNSKSLN